MTTGFFIAVYAIIATAVGMAYFAQQRWHAFFDRHGISGDARDSLALHLLIGAAAIGAAWPVAIIFALYGVYMTYARRVAGRSALRGPASRSVPSRPVSRRMRGNVFQDGVRAVSKPTQPDFF